MGEETCPDCEGEGTIIDEDDGQLTKCKKCDGSGMVEFDIAERRREAKEEAADARADQDRDERD